MKTKEELARTYVAEQKRRHAWKTPPVGRRAVVVGDGPGKNIGAAVADRLRRDGFSVTSPSLAELDVTSPPDGFFSTDASDTLVMCNGATHSAWFEDASDDLIRRMFEVNVVGSLLVARRFVAETIGDGHRKHLVFIGSTAHRSVLNGSVAYCAAKAALAHAVRCLAWELAPKGFDVFCVHPSNVEGTPMTEKTIQDIVRYRGLSREEAEIYWSANLPKARWLNPTDVAEVVSFLVSGRAEYMSGSNVDLAGGQR